MKSILVIAGIVLLSLGLMATTYTIVSVENKDLGIQSTQSTAPYEKYAIPLIVGGIVLLIVSLAVREPHTATVKRNENKTTGISEPKVARSKRVIVKRASRVSTP